MNTISKIMIFSGVLLIFGGVLIHFTQGTSFQLGRLPGDIRIESKNGSFYFPITTCLLISALMSLFGYIWRYFK